MEAGLLVLSLHALSASIRKLGADAMYGVHDCPGTRHCCSTLAIMILVGPNHLFCRLDSQVTPAAEIPAFKWSAPDEEGLVDFLVKEKNFNEDRVR